MSTLYVVSNENDWREVTIVHWVDQVDVLIPGRVYGPAEYPIPPGSDYMDFDKVGDDIGAMFSFPPNNPRFLYEFKRIQDATVGLHVEVYFTQERASSFIQNMVVRRKEHKDRRPGTVSAMSRLHLDDFDIRLNLGGQPDEGKYQIWHPPGTDNWFNIRIEPGF